MVGWRPKFPANNRIVAKINLLPHRIGCGMRMRTSATSAGHGGRFEYLDLINLFRGERRPEMRLVSRLAANTAFSPATRRRRLGRVPGVLFGGGKFELETLILGSQPDDLVS
jgi:hypothetical protein